MSMGFIGVVETELCKTPSDKIEEEMRKPKVSVPDVSESVDKSMEMVDHSVTSWLPQSSQECSMSKRTEDGMIRFGNRSIIMIPSSRDTVRTTEVTER
jgi:hypothetical protein